jgi:hypothetical protein
VVRIRVRYTLSSIGNFGLKLTRKIGTGDAFSRRAHYNEQRYVRIKVLTTYGGRGLTGT